MDLLPLSYHGLEGNKISISEGEELVEGGVEGGEVVEEGGAVGGEGLEGLEKGGEEVFVFLVESVFLVCKSGRKELILRERSFGALLKKFRKKRKRFFMKLWRGKGACSCE